MDRWTYGLSIRPYDPNTLTHQSAGTNGSPRDPPPCPRYTYYLVALMVLFFQIAVLPICCWNYDVFVASLPLFISK